MKLLPGFSSGGAAAPTTQAARPVVATEPKPTTQTQAKRRVFGGEGGTRRQTDRLGSTAQSQKEFRERAPKGGLAL